MITINKQSSIRIAESMILYFDPFQIEVASHDADCIFVTHEHFDHFDPDSIEKVSNDHTVLFAPESMKKKVLSDTAFTEDRCIFCQPDSEYETAEIKVKTVRAYNNMKPFHMKGSNWLGYVVNMAGTRYYVAGDTDANEDNKNVKCDVALLPVGGHYTMDKKHAAEFACLLKPQIVIPTHYGDVVGKPEDGMEFARLMGEMSSDIRVEVILNT